MAVTIPVYGLFTKSLADKLIDFDTDVIKCMLCTSAYTPNQDTHQFKSSVTNEVTGTGYTAGGATIGSASMTYNAGTNTLMLDGNDVSWPSSTITARYGVVYDSTPATDATRPLICYIDFGADVPTSNSTFQITWDAGGIITMVAT